MSTKPGARRSIQAELDLERYDQSSLRLQTLRRLFDLTEPYARARNTLLALVVVRAVQLPVISWYIAWLLAGPIARGDLPAVGWGVAGFVAFVLATEVVFGFRVQLALGLGERVVCDLRQKIYSHLLRMPLAFFDRMPLGRLISRVTSDVDVIRQGVADVFFISVVQAGSMLIAAGLMLYYDWLLFSFVATLVPLLWLVVHYFRDRIRLAYRDVQETYSQVTANIAESVNGVRVIQGFRREAEVARRFDALVDRHAVNHMVGAQHVARFLPLIEANTQLFLALLLVLGGYRLLNGAVGLDTLLQFFFLSELFFRPVTIIGRQYNLALTAMAGAERVFSLLDTPPAWQDEPDAVSLSQVRGDVEFDDVSFEYEPGVPALAHVSFRVNAGQTVALVGRTGGGKTTITRLLSKLYQPDTGRVLIDGVDLRWIQSDSLHRVLGSVPQQNLLFSGSVLENVRLARPNATMAEVQAAAERLGVWDLLSGLPRGLDTDVGEKGANLSLGQRQVVCFLRALLAEPQLLVLDEATSAVDSRTEFRLQQAQALLLSGRTAFIVAHRLSTIRHADLVLVIDQGRIVERGRHDELIAAGGYYAALYGTFEQRSTLRGTMAQKLNEVSEANQSGATAPSAKQ